MSLFYSPAKTDAELVARCVRGEGRAQRQFYERFSGKMMAVCLRYCGNRPDAEDCLLESFAKIFRILDRFEGLGSLEGWVRRIIVREALQRLRRQTVLFADTEAAEVQEAAATLPAVVSELGTEELLTLVAALPEGYRLVFNLSVVEGYDHEEIGQMLNISPVTSRSQLSRARVSLQKLITRQYAEAKVRTMA